MAGVTAVSDVLLLKDGLTRVEPRLDELVEYFYARLFIENPAIRTMFPLAMNHQRDRLLSALIGLVDGLGEPQLLAAQLAQLGRDHRKFGVQPAQFDAVGRALLAALARYTPGWTDELAAAWEHAYHFAARVMIQAATAETGPASWTATVVEHERRGEDIAVVIVRPDTPYPFEAGQYCSLETPYHPRVWRNYSIANAPRPDGELEFHVRRLGMGWVSGALVGKLRIGDVLQVGPPMGDMVLDHSSARDVVLVGGGTGLAPMKALVEELARHRASRRVHLFFGVRTRAELYRVHELQQLAARCPWLVLRVAVSDEDYPGLCATLPDAIGDRDWSGHDAYVCGPPAMVRATVGRFAGLGIPADRIRHDPLPTP